MTSPIFRWQQNAWERCGFRHSSIGIPSASFLDRMSLVPLRIGRQLTTVHFTPAATSPYLLGTPGHGDLIDTFDAPLVLSEPGDTSCIPANHVRPTLRIGECSVNPVCRVCGTDLADPIFVAEVLQQPVRYFECSNCTYVQTETPTWLDQAYASVINDCDTGIMVRNQTNARIVLGTLASMRRKHGRVVDFAGGYGILVRLLRDRGIDAYWSDPYCQNLVAMGFAHDGGRADLVTAFEAFEHFVSPVAEMETLFKVAPNLLLSTDVIPEPTPDAGTWWYYGHNHGQHVGFFRVRTFEYLAKKFRKHFISDGRSYHLFTEQPVRQANWNFSKKIAQYLPRIMAYDLQSKVWSDFKEKS